MILPSGKEILLTDTVGFIRNLPKELVNAFRATLEELGGSSLLIHVADASDEHLDEKIESVENILESTGYDSIPRFIVFNKIDNAPPVVTQRLQKAYKAPLISAFNKETFGDFIAKLDSEIEKLTFYQQQEAVSSIRELEA